jgi:hypothetical protein
MRDTSGDTYCKSLGSCNLLKPSSLCTATVYASGVVNCSEFAEVPSFVVCADEYLLDIKVSKDATSAYKVSEILASLV